MAKRRLSVTKWLGTTPAVAACVQCNREFKVPMSELARTKDAQASLQKQFDQHICEESIRMPHP
jgi:hypothetical protein